MIESDYHRARQEALEEAAQAVEHLEDDPDAIGVHEHAAATIRRLAAAPPAVAAPDPGAARCHLGHRIIRGDGWERCDVDSTASLADQVDAVPERLLREQGGERP